MLDTDGRAYYRRVPVQDADRLRSANRVTSPTWARTLAATTRPTPCRGSLAVADVEDPA